MAGFLHLRGGIIVAMSTTRTAHRTSESPMDQRPQGAWDELLSRVAGDWARRLELLAAASEELRRVDRNARRLVFLDEQIERVETSRDSARRDLVALDRRMDIAVERAAEEAGRTAKWNRSGRIEEARLREREWQEEATGATRRTIVARMASAERELQTLHQERAPIGLDPTLHDPMLVDWLRVLGGIVDQTLERDRAEHKAVVGPWQRRREVSLAVSAGIERLCGDEARVEQAIGEGPIHVVAGRRLAVLEVREGRGTIRIDTSGEVPIVLEVRPDDDTPVGLWDGTVGRLQEATALVATATGGRPAPVLVVTGWSEPPAVTAGFAICSPSDIGKVLDALPPTDLGPSDLAAAAAALQQMPLPELEPLEPPSLAHLRTVEPDDVPETLPSLRLLVESARAVGSAKAHSRSHAAA